MFNRYTDVQLTWVVRRGDKRACINVACITKLFSNGQVHDAVKVEKKKRKEKAITSNEAVSTWPEKLLDQVFFFIT